jgi:hypothetical protein
MTEASADCTDYPLTTLSRDQIEYLADRLFSRGTSPIATTSAAERQDLILASRCLRRLLAAYERAGNRQLSALMICGGQ